MTIVLCVTCEPGNRLLATSRGSGRRRNEKLAHDTHWRSGTCSRPARSLDRRRPRPTAQQPPDEEYQSALRYLEQGWSADTANWWYYLSQGTVFAPYEWFLALEQADGQELFASPGNMSRMGFLVDPPHPEYNPDGLPVGFAKRELALDKGIFKCWKGNWVGFGCAACHTGQVNYRGYQIRIEGGAAHHDIEAFQTQFGAAINAARQR